MEDGTAGDAEGGIEVGTIMAEGVQSTVDVEENESLREGAVPVGAGMQIKPLGTAARVLYVGAQTLVRGAFEEGDLRDFGGTARGRR